MARPDSKLPYFILVPPGVSQECLELYKEYRDGRVGDVRLANSCGHSKNIAKWKRIALDIVIGTSDYAILIGNARHRRPPRQRARPSRRTRTVVTFKLDKELDKVLEDAARKLGVKKSDIIREAVLEWLKTHGFLPG